MNQELQATLERLRELAKATPWVDTRPDCPAVDGEVPPGRLVERVLMREGRPSVDLLPNCKGPCIQGDSGLHFQLTETKAAKLCACGRANQRLLSLRAMKLPPEAIEKNHMTYDWSAEGAELREKVYYILRAMGTGEQKALILCGAPGTGKTHLLYTFAYLAAFRARGSLRVTYISQPHYLLVSGSKAIIIDELGYGRQTDWEKAEMNRLIHAAWAAGLTVIIATDIGWERLGRFLDERIKDRLLLGTEKKRLVPTLGGVPVVSLDNKRAYSRKTAEEALLGGAMLRPEVFLEVQTELKATDFGDPLHRGIWETLEQLTGAGRIFTSFDVLSELQKKGEVDTERFMGIASHIPAGVSGQIETVKEASRMEGLRSRGA
jgi:DNA replication protein DnaC